MIIFQNLTLTILEFYHEKQQHLLVTVIIIGGKTRHKSRLNMLKSQHWFFGDNFLLFSGLETISRRMVDGRSVDGRRRRRRRPRICRNREMMVSVLCLKSSSLSHERSFRCVGWEGRIQTNLFVVQKFFQWVFAFEREELSKSCLGTKLV